MFFRSFLTFTTPPSLQTAVAYGLGKDDAYFTAMREGFARSRARMTDGLGAAGYALLPSDGTYFVSVDLNGSGIALDDMTFCHRAVREAGVAAIPVSYFYASDPVTTRTEEHTTELKSLMRISYAVFCFK